MLKPIQYLFPSFWASYLINSDKSSLSSAEISLIESILDNENLPSAADCEDYGFTTWHDARNYGVLPCDCQKYTFLIKN